MQTKLKLLAAALLLPFSMQVSAQQKAPAQVWPTQKAQTWYAQHQWLVGADFIPSTAINQLEMWQADTFDPKTIDKELGYAQGIGMNVMRVFLHHLAWQQDPEGFKKRMDQYLTISSKHGIETMFVFFDDCWNKEAKIGKQPEPKPGIHNSGWMQDPGQPASENPANFPALEKYVKDVLKHFSADKRILLWDLYNEPGNSGKGDKSLPLLKNVFKWAREVNPTQPVSAGVWSWKLETLNAYQVANSDVITYHDYTTEPEHLKTVQFLKMMGRPLICTEYMARPRNSLFSTVLPMLKKENVGAINWGFVSGKTNTIYAWDTPMPDGSEPKLWFHDIFHKDGTPYKPEETELIKSLTNRGK
ncbi:cellulase family glycosylhydrolase [Mucilaginibacter sabulilitoris]|uniref:Cellulase family glycosylhydrolase n=1 Tax=Mucilaginibacter sabulilitoris TaxID=1173583 RepID=A0ABZ0TIX4_9SPHI|nr:cellulase family glycosylhydrolase [Mucilaginibacter sabulilitoris]WPU92123.1 cellulase family glycosylhydrolase [Mucilaginibacter sabulilitoris]